MRLEPHLLSDEFNKYHHTKNQLGIKAEAYTTDETAEGWTYGQGLHCTQTWTISMY